MKIIGILFFTFVVAITHCLSASVDVDLPPEIANATDIKVSKSDEKEEIALKLKSEGKWQKSKEEINKLIPDVKWIVFVVGKNKMPHVLQVENGKAIIFFETLTLRYKIYIPLELMLKGSE